MIISHKHRFIFIKTRKTAGSSIEIALSRFCGDEDVITELPADEEEIRRALGYRGCQNNQLSSVSGRDGAKIKSHASAAYVRQLLGEERWNTYFKFCFERNPFDKAISRYYWDARKKRRPRNLGQLVKYIFSKKENPLMPSLGDFLEKAPKWMLSNWDSYTIDDQIAVDFVGRYENMQQDLLKAGNEIGLPEPITLPEFRAKGGYRGDRRHYREVLAEGDRQVIERVCRQEIEAFGYTWS